MKKIILHTKSSEESMSVGERIGRKLTGGEIIELASDVGGGKTTFTKGIAKGLGVSSPVTSPTFTLSRVYDGESITLHHYDLYRLDDIGIMKDEISEVVSDESSVAVIEWAGLVEADLPRESLIKIELQLVAENEEFRTITILIPDRYEKLAKELEKKT